MRTQTSHAASSIAWRASVTPMRVAPAVYVRRTYPLPGSRGPATNPGIVSGRSNACVASGGRRHAPSVRLASNTTPKRLIADDDSTAIRRGDGCGHQDPRAPLGTNLRVTHSPLGCTHGEEAVMKHLLCGLVAIALPTLMACEQPIASDAESSDQALSGVRTAVMKNAAGATV